jgi:hypothetical protein
MTLIIRIGELGIWGLTLGKARAQLLRLVAVGLQVLVMMLVAVLLLMRMHPLLLLDVVMGVVMVVVPVVPLAMLSGGSSPTSATPRRRPMRAFVSLRSRPIFLLHHLFMSF